MFDSPFKIRYVNHFQRKDNGLSRKVHLFAFRGKKNTPYLIECEEFENHFIAIKYFQQCDRDKSTDIKFGRLTHLREATRVIASCIQAMLHFVSKNPIYSFGFIGSPTFENENDKRIANTKRFRVYSYLMINSFSPITYQHVVDVNRSTYMIIKRDLSESRSKKLDDTVGKILNFVPK